MLYGIGLSGTGGQIDRARLENVSNNLANIETVGFKRDLLTMMERPVESQDVQLPWEAERLFWQHDLLDKIGGGVHLNKTHTVHEVGPLVSTGNQEDFALTNDGFFTVEEAGSNQKFYTRAGDFEVNQDGWLVTKDGQHFVLNSKGAHINVGDLMRENGATTFSANSKGSIQIVTGAGTVNTGETIGVAVFENRDLPLLEKIGRNMYRAPEAAINNAKQLTDMPESATQVRQGFIETSGVEAASVMAEMIEVNRSFERNMRMLSLQDETLRDLVSRVGKI